MVLNSSFPCMCHAVHGSPDTPSTVASCWPSLAQDKWTFTHTHCHPTAHYFTLHTLPPTLGFTLPSLCHLPTVLLGSATCPPAKIHIPVHPVARTPGTLHRVTVPTWRSRLLDGLRAVCAFAYSGLPTPPACYLGIFAPFAPTGLLRSFSCAFYSATLGLCVGGAALPSRLRTTHTPFYRGTPYAPGLGTVL